MNEIDKNGGGAAENTGARFGSFSHAALRRLKKKLCLAAAAAAAALLIVVMTAAISTAAWLDAGGTDSTGAEPEGAESEEAGSRTSRQEMLESLVTETEEAVREAYSGYLPEALRNGENVRSALYRDDSETAEDAATRTRTLTRHVCSAETLSLTVEPDADGMEVTDSTAYELIARYAYLQYYLAGLSKDELSKNGYSDSAVSLTDPGGAMEGYLDLVSACTGNTGASSPFFSCSVDVDTEDYTETSESTAGDGWTERTVTVTTSGTVTVTVSMNPGAFLRSDYSDAAGNRHRGLETVAEEQGGTLKADPGADITAAGTDMTDAQAAIVSACRSVPSPGSGLCATWVSQVYAAAGFPGIGGNACDMWRNCCSLSSGEIEPGMMIAVEHSASTGAGYTYGHVGIYIGGGYVMDSITWSGGSGGDAFTILSENAGGAVRMIKLEAWIAENNVTGSLRWGYPESVGEAAGSTAPAVSSASVTEGGTISDEVSGCISDIKKYIALACGNGEGDGQ